MFFKFLFIYLPVLPEWETQVKQLPEVPAEDVLSVPEKVDGQ